MCARSDAATPSAVVTSGAPSSPGTQNNLSPTVIPAKTAKRKTHASVLHEESKMQKAGPIPDSDASQHVPVLSVRVFKPWGPSDPESFLTVGVPWLCFVL